MDSVEGSREAGGDPAAVGDGSSGRGELQQGRAVERENGEGRDLFIEIHQSMEKAGMMLACSKDGRSRYIDNGPAEELNSSGEELRIR